MSSTAAIMVVEDDQTLAAMLRAVLSGEGYRVVVATNGDEALRIVLQSPPDLLLLDLLLPGKSGMDVLRLLRQDHATMHIPVIMVTARGEVADKVQAFDLRVNDYLTKPFNTDELLARVRAHLHHAQTVFLSPLTQLPGGTQIERAISQRCEARAPWAMLYLDLDHFKALNDFYGFLRGNEMILLLARTVVESVRTSGNPLDFVGHIGGEDFVVITTPDRVHPLCQAIIQRFEAASRHFYRSEDLARGGFVAAGRDGQQRFFHLVSVSIAALLSERLGNALSFEELSLRVASLKAQSKGTPGSCYVIDGEPQTYSGVPPAVN